MESLVEHNGEEQPRKRPRLDSEHINGGQEAPSMSSENHVTENVDADVLKERAAGITEFVSSGKTRFSGILKKRYTDFLVNEILPSNEVLHLYREDRNSAPEEAGNPAAASGNSTEQKESTSEEQPQADQNGKAGDASTDATEPVSQDAVEISPEDQTELQSILGEDVVRSITELHGKVTRAPNAKPAKLGTVASAPLTDRAQRTALHQLIRRVFNSKIESSSDGNGVITFSAAPRNTRGGGGKPDLYGRSGTQIQGRVGWQQLGGEYLHFSVFKENKDTMEVVSFLARELRLGTKAFQFAGTKDRRAVTVQRVSAYRLTSDKLRRINRKLRGAAVGGFKHEKQSLELGDLAGNEFTITLRDCQFGQDVDTKDQKQVYQVVRSSLDDLREKGFLNYFGLQRFGTFATQTHEIGLKMLQGDFKAACDLILEYSPDALAPQEDNGDGKTSGLVSSDDRARASAIKMFRETGKSHQALQVMPRKFSAEMNLIRSLGGGNRSADYQGALRTIPRNLRTMYVHAYQSLVWNQAAGERWRKYGRAVVEGDLVITQPAETTLQDEATAPTQAVDESGEVTIEPASDDRSKREEDRFERARPLSQEEAASGKYSIFDIVLPQPGFDVEYPTNSIGEFYKTFMASEEGGRLDPHNMRRAWRDVSLSGSYRKLFARPLDVGPLECRVLKYDDEDAGMVLTDMDRMQGRTLPLADLKADGSVEQEAADFATSDGNIAIVLTLQLSTSQYATVALRELLGPGGVRAWKPKYGSGR